MWAFPTNWIPYKLLSCFTGMGIGYAISRANNFASSDAARACIERWYRLLPDHIEGRRCLQRRVQILRIHLRGGRHTGVCLVLSSALKRLQRVDDLLVVAVYFDGLPDFHDLAGGVDQKRRSLDAHLLLAVHVLFTPGAVLLGHLVIDVG